MHQSQRGLTGMPVLGQGRSGPVYALTRNIPTGLQPIRVADEQYDTVFTRNRLGRQRLGWSRLGRRWLSNRGCGRFLGSLGLLFRLDPHARGEREVLALFASLVDLLDLTQHAGIGWLGGRRIGRLPSSVSRSRGSADQFWRSDYRRLAGGRLGPRPARDRFGLGRLYQGTHQLVLGHRVNT